MLGRGARPHPAKVDCVIFDYAGNIERHQPLDELWDIRKTPARKAGEDAVARARAEARQRPVRAKHLGHASDLDPMTGETARTFTYTVERVIYDVVKSRNPKYPTREMIRVTYYCPERQVRQPGSPPWIWQWVCLEYDGWARSQAVQWFQRRGLGEIPSSAHQARPHLQRLPVPTSLRVVEKDLYPQIVLEHFTDPEED
jgi:DNA repair protein RadD